LGKKRGLIDKFKQFIIVHFGNKKILFTLKPMKIKIEKKKAQETQKKQLNLEQRIIENYNNKNKLRKPIHIQTDI